MALNVTWTTPQLDVATNVLLEKKSHYSDWEPVDTTQRSFFIVQNLNHSTEYKVRIWTMTQDGWLGDVRESDWMETLSENYKPIAITNITIERGKYNEKAKGVDMKIAWEPQKDQMCYYSVHWLSLRTEQQAQYNNSNPVGEFETPMSDLLFNTTYKGHLTSFISNEYYGESNKTHFTFTTPTCLDVHNNNLNICSPLPPENITTITTMVSNQLVLEVSWSAVYPIPSKYDLSLVQVRPPANFSRNVHVPGNTTHVRFEGVKPDHFYYLHMASVSLGGRSRTVWNEVKTPSPISSVWNVQTVLLAIGLLLMVAVTTLVTISLYRRHRKLKEKERRCQYFENLEREPPKEGKIYEPEGMFIADEWEIPEGALLLGDVLGEGAFGIVRKGLLQGQNQLEPLQEVAVKMLRDEPNIDDLRQFQQEIDMMKSVGQHPHIVSILGCCTCTKRMRLIVEYCALGDLQNYLRKAWTYKSCADSSPVEMNQTNMDEQSQVKYAELMVMPNGADGDNCQPRRLSIVVNQLYFEGSEEDAVNSESSLKSSNLLSFARQIAMGMEFLANNRIVHRDLAARNVLVCTNKMVKISDFGLSRDIYEQNVYHKKGAGKLPIKWMAIESLLYQLYTTQSDIWSFGILLWEIVTLGGNPYPSTPANRIFKLLKTGYRMECPSTCSPELYDLMLSCWRPKPKDRPTFTDLRNKLDALLESSTPQQYLNLNFVNFESPLTSVSTVEHLSSGLSNESQSNGEYCNTTATAHQTEPRSRASSDCSSK